MAGREVGKMRQGWRGFSAVGALVGVRGPFCRKGGCPRLIFSWSSRSFALGAAAAGESVGVVLGPQFSSEGVGEEKGTRDVER